MTTTTWKGDLKPLHKQLQRLEDVFSDGSLEHWLQRHEQENLRERVRTRFQTEGDDASGGWTPLTDVTLEIRARKGFSASPINVRTGELKDWAEGGQMAVSGGGGNLIGTYPASLPGGELLEKVQTAQRGRDKRPITPARPVLALGDADAYEAITSLSNFIAREAVL